MKVSEKLKTRLEKDFGIIATDFKRTYAGYNQREEGAWRWAARAGRYDIGSSYPMDYIVKCKKLEIYNNFGDYEIIPVED